MTCIKQKNGLKFTEDVDSINEFGYIKDGKIYTNQGVREDFVYNKAPGCKNAKDVLYMKPTNVAAYNPTEFNAVYINDKGKLVINDLKNGKTDEMDFDVNSLAKIYDFIKIEK